MDRFVESCCQNGRFVVENIASAISELARHLLVLQNAFVLSHDNLVEQDRLCGAAGRARQLDERHVRVSRADGLPVLWRDELWRIETLEDRNLGG